MGSILRATDELYLGSALEVEGAALVLSLAEQRRRVQDGAMKCHEAHPITVTNRV